MINIVVPVCGKKALLEQLITTTLRIHGPHEVRFFLVSNGSDTITTRYVEGLKGQPNFRVVVYPDKLGFALACNAGVRLALDSGTTGPVCFMNTDTYPVGPALDVLADFVNEDGIGATGPATNYASGIQKIQCPAFQSKRQLEAWDANRRDNTIIPTDRLVGFCLMVKDGLWQELRFDEHYGLGNFDDDDYCLQIKAKGYKMYVCHGAFVWHQGHATFTEQGIVGKKFEDLMVTNQKYFESKWGAKIAWLEEKKRALEFVQENFRKGSAQTREETTIPTYDTRPPKQQLNHVKGVVIGIPNHKGSIPYMTVQSLISVTSALAYHEIPCSIQIVPCAALHEARQNVVDAILKSDPTYTHALFIDDDMVFGGDAAKNLIATADQHDLDFVTNIAYVNAIPTGPNIFGLVPGRPEFGHDIWWELMTEWPDSLFEIAACGMAFCLVSRRMLAKMREDKYPEWCHFIYGELRSEDVAFCINARKAGFKLYCDPRAQVEHISREVRLIGQSDYKSQNGANGMRFEPGEQVTLAKCKGAGPYLEPAGTPIAFAARPEDVQPFITSSPVPDRTVFFDFPVTQAAGAG